MRTLQSALTLLRFLSPDSTEQRRILDRQLAEQRRLLAEERHHVEAQRRAQRAERRKLLLARIDGALRVQLCQAKCGQFSLPTLVGDAAISKFASAVTAIVARELDRD